MSGRKEHVIETGPTYKKPNQALLEHDRKRQVEVKCMELRIRLEDEGVEDTVIEEKIDKMRSELLEKQQEIDARRDMTFTS
ncbi:hypothetical protein G6F56_007186 [Rhizopus delemar]|nr:hypothetical protein G6F56_007186 [Rhizopus delemar]